ncbi:hypothetical protein LB566_29755 [Mesorhizobium sp. CA13]|uniref:hypothetical protein n=1 Tax=Mesorhizobium sp. CA13 TaxID=2876643 RepID=UPI001CCD1FD1|nr:hypothetical protein [Mesorhizobium sp. CA13]MBZ9857973.1 hypothetical protein [Mesorhizobium sp. CA13]
MDRQKLSPIMPSLTDMPDIPLDRLLSPARHFKHPNEVLADDALDLWEKRAILSSWASDACAVESMPELRLPQGVERPVSFDQIMEALCKLDIDASASRSTPDEFRHDFARMHA